MTSFINPLPSILAIVLYENKVTTAIIIPEIKDLIIPSAIDLPPKLPIFLLKLINNNAIVNSADILVANASPASCILVYLTNNILSVMFKTIAITPFIIGVLVSCNE